MNEYLPFLVDGLTKGSVYALAAVGLVLTYRTSGIFNFAHGAIALAAAYVFFELRQAQGVPWPIAVVLVVFVFGPLFGLFLEFLARGLARATTTAKIVATVGLLLAIQAVVVVKYGGTTRPFEPFLPTETFDLPSVTVSYGQLITVIVALVSVVGLSVFLRVSTTGVAMRAVVESPELLALTGTSPRRVRRTGWMIGCSFAAASGLLLAPFSDLDVIVLTLIVVRAFGAGAIGAFASLPLTYVGGLAIGLGESLSTKFVSGHTAEYSFLLGVPASVPFLVLFFVLVLAPGRLREAGAAVMRPMAELPIPDPRVRRAGVVLALGAALLVPAFVDTKIQVYSTAAGYVVIFASLALLVRTSGQISLVQFGFAAIGATTYAHMTDAGLPWLPALLLAGLAAVPAGAIVAIPAIRLPGLYLALATFGFGILLENLVYTSRLMFGTGTGLEAPRPGFGPLSATNDAHYYYVALAVAVAVLVLVVLLERSRLGRLLRGMADSPLALTTRGTNVRAMRLLVFCISAYLAAIGGALIAPVTGSINVAGWPSLTSLILLAVIVSVGPGTLRSPIFGAISFVVIPAYITNVDLIEGLPIVFGGVALLWAIAWDVSGVRTRLIRLATAWSPRSERSPVDERLVAAHPEDAWPAGSRRALPVDALPAGSRDRLRDRTGAR